MKEQCKQVFLIAAHYIDDEILNHYYILKKAVNALGDCILLLHDEHRDLIVPEEVNCFRFDYGLLNSLNYFPIRTSIVPGSNHFPILLFYQKNNYYNYYWNIEYDVCYSGEWKHFFDVFADIDSDFLTSHIRRLYDEPFWLWWDDLYLNELYIDKSVWLRSFNPIYRISNRGLKLLNQIQSQEIGGHHEVLIPTVLNHFGFSLTDFGGEGEFVLPGFENSFYTSEGNTYGRLFKGTMRCWPAYKTVGEIENKLYHPVKSSLFREENVKFKFC